jgi:hypothetical protein
MKKLLGLFVVIAIAFSVVPNARSLGTTPAPSGVSANDWIPLSEVAGFVVVHGNSFSNSPGVIRGYFVVQRGNAWLRVDPVPEATVLPATDRAR